MLASSEMSSPNSNNTNNSSGGGMLGGGGAAGFRSHISGGEYMSGGSATTTTQGGLGGGGLSSGTGGARRNGGGGGFCSFHQLVNLVAGVISDPSTLTEDTRVAIDISLCALLGISGAGKAARAAGEETKMHDAATKSQPLRSSGGVCSGTESETGDHHLPAQNVGANGSTNGAPQAGGTSTTTAKKSKLTDVEHLAFVLSTAFNCPNVELMKIFQRALKEAVAAKTISSNFTKLLPQSSEEGKENDTCSVEEIKNGFCWCVNPPSLALPDLLTSPSALKTHTDELHANLVASIFIETSEMANFARVLSVLPPILQAEHMTWQFLMEDPESPLLVEERLMVALMAASRHHCEYWTKKLLLRALVTPTFPRSWLNGPLPPKFEALAPLVALLAHRPWQITSQKIANVLDADVQGNGGANSPELEPWNPTTIVHAVCIASNVISLSGFTTLFQIPFEPSTAALPTELGEPTQIYLRTSENTVPHGVNDDAAPVMNYSGVPFQNFKPQISTNPEPWTVLTGEAGDGHCTSVESYDKRIKRVDKKSERDKNSIDINNFTWENHASTLIETHYPGVAQCISEQKQSIELITSAMETSALRFRGPNACPQAENDDEVWRGVTVYIHNLFGVTHPDFDYGTINKLLDKEVKRFIHKATAVPEDTIAEDFCWTVGPDVDPVLFVAVAFGAISARREAVLLQFSYHLDRYVREYC